MIFQQKDLDLTVDKISRVYFILHRDLGDDRSLNGTWVNMLRVGKGNKITLEHCSIISILCQEPELFCFLDKNIMEIDFPPSLSSKYLVGKVLGEGTTSVVMLGRTVHRGSTDDNPDQQLAKQVQPTDLMAEVTVLADMEHPCITKVEEVVEA
jgi:pSer/pThr/pTyr-binding forkhead associated (FHA) protein